MGDTCIWIGHWVRGPWKANPCSHLETCIQSHVSVHYYNRRSPIFPRVAAMDDQCLETALYCLRRLVGPTGKPLTAGQLLERFASHADQAAFELLLRRHGSLVCKVCWRILGNSHDVEDALQATWLVLF